MNKIIINCNNKRWKNYNEIKDCNKETATIHGGGNAKFFTSLNKRYTLRRPVGRLRGSALLGHGYAIPTQSLTHIWAGSVSQPKRRIPKNDLLPTEDTDTFDLRQERVEILLYESCRVKGFELRIMRGEAVKLKLDITSERSPVVYPYIDTFERASGERFHGDNVTYKINGKEYKNIYGVTLVSKKVGGAKTELWIKRTLEKGNDLPETIEEIVITAQLLRDTYEYKRFGIFRITIKRLFLISDETEINAADTVIGPLRYYVAGKVNAEVFTAGEAAI
jgi:hypothetical protein